MPVSAGSQAFVAATRLHLGNAVRPISQESIDNKVNSFCNFCLQSCTASYGIIAVDATPRIMEDGSSADLVAPVQRAIQTLVDSSIIKLDYVRIVEVTPWGKFVPALNACISFACRELEASHIVFVSAETNAPKESMQVLLRHAANDDTLVAGACLPGHDYSGPASTDQSPSTITLNGRTSPWNTLAVWSLQKLALTGFQLVSDGLLTNDDTEPSYGVEEVICIALLQKLLGADNAQAKLVRLSGVAWDQSFLDPERAKWHEQKLESKRQRAARQLELTGLSGTVQHL